MSKSNKMFLFQEKPHKCLLCSKSFPTPGDLKSHMYVHTGTWPFKCDVCQRGFSKQTNLKNHMQLHVNEKEKQIANNNSPYDRLIPPRLGNYLMNMDIQTNNNSKIKIEEDVKNEKSDAGEGLTKVNSEIHKLFRPINF